MSATELEKVVSELQTKIQLQEQRIKELEKDNEAMKTGVGRLLWTIGGGFIAAGVAWVAGGGLVK